MAQIRFLSAGESHGPKLTAIIEGLPSGFLIDKKAIDQDLARRQQGFGRGGRMKIEQDQVKISSGIVEHKTTGAPVALEITNIDYKNWQDKAITPMSSPRPGHADFAGVFKYNHDDLRLSLERASARETAIRTAVGSLCKQILASFKINIMAYVIRVGKISASTSHLLKEADYFAAYKKSLSNEFAFIDPDQCEAIKEHINEIMKAKDTLGGVFETVAIGLPPGLGSYAHYDRRLDAQLAASMMSIPAMKAVEIGDGINNAGLTGTKVHDEFLLDGQKISRSTNRAGGLEGGMTNAMPLVIKTYMKPISTTLNPRKSVDLANNETGLTIYERSDFCAIQRAAVIGEAMMSIVLLNALVDKIGGDNQKDMQKSYESIFKGHLFELSMKKEPWKFNYDYQE